MYAVIKTGGKQYRVEQDDLLSVETVAGELGDKVVFDQVLMMGEGESVTIGSPTIGGATVTAEIVDQYRTRKVMVFRKRRRKNSRRLNSHRQNQTMVKITGISAK